VIDVMLMKLVSVSILASTVVFAHCDSLDGPVVQAARQSLSTGDVNHVLPWIQAGDEPAIRQAFQHTMAVRTLNKDAEKLADTWFFETLVRVHRAGEGAPYTGLKAAGTDVAPGVLAADQAVVKGDLQKLEKTLVDGMRQGLLQRFARVLKTKDYEQNNVNAGREYVAAYVDFVHFVERLDQLSNTAHEHGSEHVH
jgi:uncharacterized protein DUF6448